MRTWLAAIKQIVHFYSGFTEVGGVGHAQSDQVMQGCVRVGIRTDGHTPAAIGSDFSPVGEALLRIDLPSQAAIRLRSPRSFGDGMRRAGCDAFLAMVTKIDHGRCKYAFIKHKREIGGDDRDTNPGAKTRGHQQSHPSNFP